MLRDFFSRSPSNHAMIPPRMFLLRVALFRCVLKTLGRVGLALMPAFGTNGVAAQEGPLPDPHSLVKQQHARQKQLDAVRENYTYTAHITEDELDAQGHVKKTETREEEAFFVHGHPIRRLIRKNGQPLSDKDLDQEETRVRTLVERAQNDRLGHELGMDIDSVQHLLGMMALRNPRHDRLHGRNTLILEIAGRCDGARGLEADLASHLSGTLWIDEADLQIARAELHFDDGVRVAAGLLIHLQKGSHFHLEQTRQGDGLWMPTESEGQIQARLLLFKQVHQHWYEHDSDLRRFHVSAEPAR